MLGSSTSAVTVGKLLHHHNLIAVLQQLAQTISYTNRQNVTQIHGNEQLLLESRAACAESRPWQQAERQHLCGHTTQTQPLNLMLQQQPWHSTYSFGGIDSRSNVSRKSPTALAYGPWQQSNALSRRSSITLQPLAAPAYMQWQRMYVRPCSDSIEEEPAVPAGVTATRGVSTTSGPAAAAPPSSIDAADDHSSTSEGSRTRRRDTTEGRAILRRTTESRPAIEDVSVMTKSQLLRRNKPWLKEQCNHKGLPYDGLKEDLVQRLLAWQGTDAGKAAAVAAREAIAAATKAVQEVHAATAAVAAERQAAAAAEQLHADAAAGAIDPPPTVASASAVATAVFSNAVTEAGTTPQVESVASSSRGMSSRRRQRSTTSTSSVTAASSTGSGSIDMQAAAASASAPQAGQQQQQPPRSAAAAAVDTLTALLEQLQEQHDNAALVAVARNSLEVYVQGLTKSNSSTLAASSSTAHPLVAELSGKILASSSPQSIAALAAACYSREVQSPVLAAAMSEAVAAVAKQLGPQEVYRVLRLLVEHLGDTGADGAGFNTLDKGFRVLAEGFIGCSEALEPMHLAEAVDLLWKHKYDDAYGLWMISKEAAARLHEFQPCDVVVLLDAVAGMCVADDALCNDVAAAVAGNRVAYTAQQLQSVSAALHRMGYSKKM